MIQLASKSFNLKSVRDARYASLDWGRIEIFYSVKTNIRYELEDLCSNLHL